jgi:hypothetical protein
MVSWVSLAPDEPRPTRRQSPTQRFTPPGRIYRAFPDRVFRMTICPVCDFDMPSDPATDWHICPSCWTAFVRWRNLNQPGPSGERPQSVPVEGTGRVANK